MSTSAPKRATSKTESASDNYRTSALSSSSSSSIENISYASKTNSPARSNKNANESIDKTRSKKTSEEEYDYCKEFKFISPKHQQKPVKQQLRNNNNSFNRREFSNPSSPMKRNKTSNEESSTCAESPQKRQCRVNYPNENSVPNSPKLSSRISVSLCLDKGGNKAKISSTPKSERRLNPVSRLKQLQDSEEVQRNLSSSWADIIEELEQQTKELTEYSDKVAAKYSLDKEKLKKSLELDAETLRKRQKKINYGKLTPEYQRYLLAVQKKHREPFHPRTPNKFRKCSRRMFDGSVKMWRKLLHVWDENPDKLKDFKYSMEEQDREDFGGTSQIEQSSVMYNVDDYDIIDYSENSDK